MEEGRPRAPGRVAWLVGLSVLLGAMAGGSMGGLTAYLVSRGDGAGEQPPFAQTILDQESVVTEAVQRALPAVVAIFAEGAPGSDASGRPVERLSLGSGVIIDERGYIVTNEHVVRDALRLTVVLAGGEERPARLVGHDAPFTDLAVLKIAAGGLQSIALGDSASLAPGQRVIAIGNSIHDFRSSVTLGVVSGTGRRWYKEDYGLFLGDLIQTDAAVNPGNSGGALINLRGQLVGLPTTVVRTDSDAQVQGIAFAISSRTVANVAGEIVARGGVDRASLGAVHQDLWPELADRFGLAITRGALITEVVANGPAAAAGLRRGDVILRIDRFELTPELPLLNVLLQLRPGQRVDIVIVRNGETLTIAQVALGHTRG